MLDIGWQELFIVAVLALIVVGPKDLPRALKTVMHYVRKARGLAREFQSGVDEMVREADMDDLKKDLAKISNPAGLENTIKEAVDPDGDLTKAMDLTDVQGELEKTAKDAVKETEPDAAEKPVPDDITGEDVAIIGEDRAAKEIASDVPAEMPERPETTDAEKSSASTTNS